MLKLCYLKSKRFYIDFCYYIIFTITIINNYVYQIIFINSYKFIDQKIDIMTFSIEIIDIAI